VISKRFEARSDSYVKLEMLSSNVDSA